jgi:hypothetical protein
MEGIYALVKGRTERSPQNRTSEKEKIMIVKKRKSSAITKESVDVNGIGPRRLSAFATESPVVELAPRG